MQLKAHENISYWRYSMIFNSLVFYDIYVISQYISVVTKLNLNKIKSVLAEKNKSSKELARHLDKTESTVSRWCTNEVQPSIETLYAISKFLKVDIRELLVSTMKWLLYTKRWRASLCRIRTRVKGCQDFWIVFSNSSSYLKSLPVIS